MKILHIPDVGRGRDENGDVKFGFCGKRVLGPGGSDHGFGLMRYQINCQECISKAEETEITPELERSVGPWMADWRV